MTGGSIHRPFRGYQAPSGFDTEFEEEFDLSYSSSVGKHPTRLPRVDREEDGQRPANIHLHWRTQRAKMRPGVDTELLTINAAESLADEKNNTSITLYCEKNVLGVGATTPPNQVHWL